MLDYTLRDAAKLVKFSILDGSGKLVRTLSSADKPSKIDVDKIDIPAYWIHPEAPLSGSKGGHRLIWDLRFHDDGGPIVPPGKYMVRMVVDGSSFSQSLTVVNDPRVAATQADLESQFKLALAVGDEIEVAKALQTRIQAMLKKPVFAKQRARLLEILGGGGSGTPDEGGTTPMDFGSLRRIIEGLQGVKGAIQSAPSAPLAQYVLAFRGLKGRVATVAAELKR
jgi:hypothetical protein